MMVTSRLQQSFHLIGLLIVLCIALFPFFWMVTSSFKAQTDLLASPPVWFFMPTPANYEELFADQKIITAVINSLIVASSTTILSIILGTPAAFALARYEFRGKSDLWFWFISNRMISPIVLALPFYIIAKQIGLLNSHLSLILIYLTFNLPIVVWICTDQFRGIPKDIEQAARLDGASQFNIFLRIYLPIGLPGVAVSAIFAFIFSWNELLYGLVLITSQELKTAPVVATNFMSGYELPWGKIMATGTVIVLPVILFALAVSRHMIRGLTMGATK